MIVLVTLIAEDRASWRSTVKRAWGSRGGIPEK